MFLYTIGTILGSEKFAGKFPPPPAATGSSAELLFGQFNPHLRVNQWILGLVKAWGCAFKDFQALFGFLVQNPPIFNTLARGTPFGNTFYS